MRVAMAVLVAILAVHQLAAPAGLSAAPASSQLQQQPPPDTQPQQTAPAAQQDDAEMTSAGWANILWMVLVLVAAVAFVWLGMTALRSPTRQ